jgi:hypothetical protein
MTQVNPWICSEGAQVEPYRERCVPKVLKLSCEVSECKPLLGGNSEMATNAPDGYYDADTTLTWEQG